MVTAAIRDITSTLLPVLFGCVSADLNLCHAALVGLQLSHAFNGSCWCHEPTMATSTYQRCLDVHLKVFYHPCIARINSRINGRRRMEIEQQEQQKRREQEEEQRRREQWKNYWHQQQGRLTSVASPAPFPTTSAKLATVKDTTTSGLSHEQLEARRLQQRLEYERQLLEHGRRQEEFERQRQERRRQEFEQQRQRTTWMTFPWPTESLPSGVPSTSTTTHRRTSSVAATYLDILGITDSTRVSPRQVFRTEFASPRATSATFAFAEGRPTSTVFAASSTSAVITPRHRIRHFQEKLDAIGRGEITEDDVSAEELSRRHKPSVVETGGTINGHSVSDFSNLFSPNHLDRVDGEQRPRPKLSVPGENHWSCTKSLERCLDHVACTRLLELYREKCRVDNQKCVSTDWKSCKEAYEGIRWTGLNNCTCSDDHRLHGPSCHFVELLTAHNQCIDQFKRAGYISDDNGPPFYAGKPGTGPTLPTYNRSTTGRNSKRPEVPGPLPTTARNLTTARPSLGTDSKNKPIPVPTKVLPTRKPIASATTSSRSSPKTTIKTTTTSKPTAVTKATNPESTTTKKAPVGRPVGTGTPGAPGRPGLDTDDIDDDDDGIPDKPEKPQVFLPPKRYPTEPISRMPQITWGEWDRRRVVVPPALPISAAFKQISNREIALGAMTYRIESTCQMAYSHCHWDDTCSWQLSEIKSYCTTICDKQRCAAATSRFYKYVSLDFQEGLTFCTCRSHDTECLEYQRLLFPSCLRQMQRHEWRECGDLKIECRNNDQCWPWAEKYFDNCRWDPVRGRCAGNPYSCRQAILGIRGTPLDSDCACLPNSPDCEAIQNALYFRNPCFEESRLTMLPKFTTRRPTTSTSTTTTTTRKATSTATAPPPRRRPATTTERPLLPPTEINGTEELPGPKPTPRPRPLRPMVSTTKRPRITSVTTKRPKLTTPEKEIARSATKATAEIPEDLPPDWYDDETTTVAETVGTTETTTETTIEVTTTTESPTTTPATPQCETMDQETKPLRMRTGSLSRVYTDRFTRCSSLCKCSDAPTSEPQTTTESDFYIRPELEKSVSEFEMAEPVVKMPEPILDCHPIDCMADIPCPGGTWLGYGAPAFRMNQDKCTCISGDFVCRRLPQAEVPEQLVDDEGLFLTVGYSQKEVNWLVQHFPRVEIREELPVTSEEFLDEMKRELEKAMNRLSDTSHYPCELIERMHEGNNYIFEVRLAPRPRRKPGPSGVEEVEGFEEVADDVCRLPVKRLARALDDDRFRNDVILSVVKEAIVDDRLAYSGCVRNFNVPNLLQFLVLYFACAAAIRWLWRPE